MSRFGDVSTDSSGNIEEWEIDSAADLLMDAVELKRNTHLFELAQERLTERLETIKEIKDMTD